MTALQKLADPVLKFGKLLLDAGQRYMDDKASLLGAALAFYSVFSLAPGLVIVITIVGIFFDPASVEQEIIQEVSRVIGEGTVSTVTTIINSASHPGENPGTAIVGAATLIAGATAFFSSLKSALDTIWQIDEDLEGGFFEMLRTRGLALLFMTSLSLVVVALLLTDSVLIFLADNLSDLVPGFAYTEVRGVLRTLFSVVIVRFGLITLLTTMTFKVLPAVKIRWRDLWVGAAVTSLLFLLGQALIGIYFDYSSIGSAYGAAGSLVVILVWIYYSAQVFLFGAEFTHAYAEKYGQPIEADGVGINLFGDDSAE